jgi:flavin-dependent dehydrogenase
MINPLTGEGIFYAMFAGELLGRLLARTGEKPNLSAIAAALLEYETQFRRQFTRHFDLNWKMKQRAEVARLCNLVINACRKDEVVIRDLIGLIMGGETDIRLGTLLRVFARNLLPF